MIGNPLRHIARFLIGTNTYIALISSLLAFTGFLLFDTTDKLLSTALVFFATQTAYNLQRYFKWKKQKLHVFLKTIVPETEITWLLLIITSCIGLGITSLFLNTAQWILLGLVGIITASYLFVNPITKKLTGIRYVPFLKTIAVAFCWTSLFFIVTYEKDFEFAFKQTYIYWLVLFLQVLQACVLFDLRDIEADANQVKTFANTLPGKSLIVFWGLLLLAIIIPCLQENNLGSLYAMPFWLTAAAIQVYCIMKKSSPLNFTLMVDGSLVLFSLANYLVFS